MLGLIAIIYLFIYNNFICKEHRKKGAAREELNPHIRQPLSLLAQRKIKIIAKKYCTGLDIRLAFTSYKLSNMFSVKDSIPNALRSQVVYKFTCAGRHACYVGETTRHFGTRVREHLSSDHNSHIYKHLQAFESCKNLCSFNCFFHLRLGSH